MEEQKQENIKEQIVFWQLRLAETQREHITLLLVDVNNTDTWEVNLKSSVTRMKLYWKEIKYLQEKLWRLPEGVQLKKGEN